MIRLRTCSRAVFGWNKPVLLCQWHIGNNWRDKLRRKVKLEATRAAIMSDMRALMHTNFGAECTADEAKRLFEEKLQSFYHKHATEAALVAYGHYGP
jgi:hypothetical protein